MAQLKGRAADKDGWEADGTQLAYPAHHLEYRIDVTAEPGGVRVSVNLDQPLPEKLAGRAGFNLEFLPSAYVDKAYIVDGKTAGVLPRTPRDPMVKVMPLADEPKKLTYQEEWDVAKGYTQPLPFASGKDVTLAADDPQSAGARDLRDRSHRSVRRSQPGAERMVRAAHDDSGGQDGWGGGVAHPSGRDPQLDPPADGGSQPGGLSAELPQGSGDRARPAVQPRRRRRSCGWSRTAPTGRCLKVRCPSRRRGSGICTRSSISAR